MRLMKDNAAPHFLSPQGRRAADIPIHGPNVVLSSQQTAMVAGIVLNAELCETDMEFLEPLSRDVHRKTYLEIFNAHL